MGTARISHGLAFSTCLVCLPVVSRGQVLSPYSDFQAMSISQLQTAQVKLTSFGPQESVIASVGLAAAAFDKTVFTPFRRAGIDYSNEDFVAFRTGTVSGQDISAIISNVATLPNVTAGGVASDPVVSFALSNTVGGAKVFEAILNVSDGAALFAQLRAALLQNSSALAAVNTIACPLGLIDPAVPTNVTTSTTVSFSGFRLNRATGRFVGTATVSNTSASTIPGPISLVLQFNGGVQMANASGATCGTTPTGILYVDLPLSGGNLVGSTSATVPLDLANPNNDPIQASLTKVLAGPGAR